VPYARPSGLPAIGLRESVRGVRRREGRAGDVWDVEAGGAAGPKVSTTSPLPPAHS